MADTATFSAAMKTKFIGPIRDTLYKGRVLLWGDSDANPTEFKGITRSAEGINFVGNEFRIPLKTKRNQAVGFRSESETLPSPGASKYTYLTEPMRFAYGLFNITGQLLKAAASSEGAFVTAFKQEMEDTVLSLKMDLSRAAWNDGSGKFFDVRTTVASAATAVDVSSTINVRGGEILDFVNAAGVVISPAHEVTGIDRTNRNITITPGLAAGLTAGTHFAVRASSDSTIAVPNNSQNKEIQGIKSIVSDTGSLHGVNPATFPQWKAYHKTIGGGIADSVLRDAVDAVGFESGVDLEGAGVDFALVTTRGVRRRYADTLTAVKRFNDAEATTLRGGFRVLKFDELNLFIDDFCPLGTVAGLSLKDLFWSQMSDFEWMQEDGKVLKWESRKDRYTAVLYKYMQLGTAARNRHFLLDGLTDDVK